jgi:hypothetical protein
MMRCLKSSPFLDRGVQKFLLWWWRTSLQSMVSKSSFGGCHSVCVRRVYPTLTIVVLSNGGGKKIYS